jgi:hypothetical protein
MRRAVRAVRRQTVADGQADMVGQYRVVYADPPWLYNDNGVVTENDAYGRAERHYPGMTIEQLCATPIAAHAQENAVPFLWRASPLRSSVGEGGSPSGKSGSGSSSPTSRSSCTW